MARNRFNDLREIRYSNTEHCIFISHQKDDSTKARKIADYFIHSGIDVYFDEYDHSIDRNNPESVVNAIKTGVKKSTIMLCFLSENSYRSQWMPWEIGYGYDRTTVIGLTEKSICNIELPEYLQIVDVIKGTTSLNELISDILGILEKSLIYERKLFSANTPKHPLDDVLQWDK